MACFTASITDAATAVTAGARHPSPKYKGRVYQGPGYDEERAISAARPATEDHMEYGFASHALLWLIGGDGRARRSC